MFQFQVEQGAIGEERKKKEEEVKKEARKRKEKKQCFRPNGVHLQFRRPCISRTRGKRQSDERLLKLISISFIHLTPVRMEFISNSDGASFKSDGRATHHSDGKLLKQEFTSVFILYA